MKAPILVVEAYHLPQPQHGRSQCQPADETTFEVADCPSEHLTGTCNLEASSGKRSTSLTSLSNLQRPGGSV